MSWGDHDQELIRKKLNVEGRKKYAIPNDNRTQIDVDNKLIDKFMGIDFTGFKTVSYSTPNKYNESWDKIMDVIERIEQEGFSVIISIQGAEIRPFSYMNNFPLMATNYTEPKRESVHKLVVKFINWYFQKHAEETKPE